MSKVHVDSQVDERQIGRVQVPNNGISYSANNGLEDSVVGWKAGIIEDCTSIIMPAADRPVRWVPQLVIIGPHNFVRC